LVIDGVHSTYMLMENQNHHFFATARIPVCLSDNSLTIALQEKDLTVTCELYESVGKYYCWIWQQTAQSQAILCPIQTPTWLNLQLQTQMITQWQL
jgi:hypothetical protein